MSIEKKTTTSTSLFLSVSTCDLQRGDRRESRILQIPSTCQMLLCMPQLILCARGLKKSSLHLRQSWRSGSLRNIAKATLVVELALNPGLLTLPGTLFCCSLAPGAGIQAFASHTYVCVCGRGDRFSFTPWRRTTPRTGLSSPRADVFFRTSQSLYHADVAL